MVSVIQEFREKGPSPLLEFDRAVYLLLCLSYKVRKKILIQINWKCRLRLPRFCSSVARLQIKIGLYYVRGFLKTLPDRLNQAKTADGARIFGHPVYTRVPFSPTQPSPLPQF